MIKLDVCCGQYKHEGFMGLDRRSLDGVDIVWCITHGILPGNMDDKCEVVLFSLAWACIEPKYRLQLMDEFWRITAVDGQLHIIEQYYKGDKAHHDPTYYSCPNEWTFLYYDPSYEKYKVYEPKPWRILKYEYQENGLLYVVLTPIKEAIA